MEEIDILGNPIDSLIPDIPTPPIEPAKKDVSWVVGKIGICLDRDLGIVRQDSKASDRHFVYIHSIDKNNKCVVSPFISMYDASGKFKDYQVHNGWTLPIPKYSTNLKKFSGLQKHKIKGVPVSRIFDIGVASIDNRYKMAYKIW